MNNQPSNRKSTFEDFLGGGELIASLQIPGLLRLVDWLRVGIYLSAPFLALPFSVSTEHSAIMFIAAVACVVPAMVRLVKKDHSRVNLAVAWDFILVTATAAILNASYGGAVITVLALAAINILLYHSNRYWLGVIAAISLPWGFLMWYLRDSFFPQAGIPLSVYAPLVAVYVVILAIGVIGYRSIHRGPDKTEVHLANALDVAPLAVAVLDRSGHVVERAGDGTVLPGLQVGVLAEDAIPKYQALEMIGKAMRGERAEGVVQVDGRTVRVKMSTIERNGAISAFAVSAFDVTEQEDARRRLVATVEAKDEFIASVSHELRTPLTSVVGFAGAALDGLDAMTKPELGELLGYIASEAKDAAYMIEDLLVSARAENKTISIRPEVVDLHQLVEATLNGLPQISAVNQVEEVQGIADPHRLKQVVRNLLTNAQRYGGDSISVVSSRDDGRVSIHVRDSGDEIDPEMQKSMFEPFVRNDKNGGHSHSVGLGLTVSSQLVALMGGTLTYAHRAGWSEFTITLSEPTPDPFVPESVHTGNAAH